MLTRHQSSAYELPAFYRDLAPADIRAGRRGEKRYACCAPAEPNAAGDQARLVSGEVCGRVVLGCPDLYAALLLPRTLARFQAAHPGVEVTVGCTLSRQVAKAMEDGEIDVALATRMPDVHPRIPSITSLRREKLIWLGAHAGSAHKRDPLLVAMLPDGNLYRDHALAALDRIGRSWRIACESESIAGLQAMALADAAIIVLAGSVVVRGLQQIGPSERLEFAER